MEGEMSEPRECERAVHCCDCIGSCMHEIGGRTHRREVRRMMVEPDIMEDDASLPTAVAKLIRAMIPEVC